MFSLIFNRSFAITAIIVGIIGYGTKRDMNYRNVDHLSIYSEIDSAERRLASEQRDDKRLKSRFLTISLSEAYKINGEWELSRIIGPDEEIKYDRFNNSGDGKKALKINLELLEGSVVRVDKNNDHVYRIIALSSNGMISLSKETQTGVEIVEARRSTDKIIGSASSSSLEVGDDKQSLILERALNQNKSATVLLGPDAMGDMELTKTSIERISVTLTNPSGEVQSIDLSNVALLEGGTFNAEDNGESISGVVLNNGKDGFRVSFVTGPLAGAMLNFVTEDYMKELEDKGLEEQSNGPTDVYEAQVVQDQNENGELKQNQVENSDGEALTPEEQEAKALQDAQAAQEAQAAQAAQDQAINDRSAANSNPESAEQVDVLSAQEIKELTESQGYNF